MRLIDADALANKLQEHKDFFIDAYGGDFSFMNLKEKARVDEITNCLFEIQNAPTIEAKPVVHAHWIIHKEDKNNSYYQCSHCTYGYKTNSIFPCVKKYCSDCGAQMDEKGE